MTNIDTIQPKDLYQLQQQGRANHLLDVRTPAEFAAVHADRAQNVPLDQLDASGYVSQQRLNGDQPLYVICKSGGRSAKACQQFIDSGYANVVNVTGGTSAWEAAGLPVTKSASRVMPLDCQVRVFAGSMVLLGTILGWLAHPAFAGLAAFIGAGFVYSGLTNTCMMGDMLAKMPWNQAPSSTGSATLQVAAADPAACDTGG